MSTPSALWKKRVQDAVASFLRRASNQQKSKQKKTNNKQNKRKSKSYVKVTNLCIPKHVHGYKSDLLIAFCLPP